MKLKLTAAALCLAAAVPLTGHAECAISTVNHTETTGYNWYCRNNNEGKPPCLPPEFSFINDNGGYYLDTKAADTDKVIYLTFDAGYENGNIAKILDVLKKHQAKGAFFVLGNLIKRDTGLVKRMLDEGHLVCNHTNQHRDMTKVTDPAKFREELESLSAIMKKYCGCDVAPFYRPPEGRFSEANLKTASEMGCKTVFWSFAYADWDNRNQMSPEKAMKKVLSHTHNGEVILLHPTSATNAEILDPLLTEWEKQGYRFGTLYELTADS